MGLQAHGDTIESLLQERRGAQREAKQLQDQIDLLRAKKLEKNDPDTLKALDEQIEELTLEKKERAQKLEDICRMARTISAGD